MKFPTVTARHFLRSPYTIPRLHARVPMSTLSQMSGDNAQALEREKHAGREWKEALASESEANIKSDRAPERPFSVLRSETIAQLHGSSDSAPHKTLENDIKSATRPVIGCALSEGRTLEEAERELMDVVFAKRDISGQIVEQVVVDVEDDVVSERNRK
ncbi:hypothetical protein BC938DRAFT_472705 [Jimgerdemannia flammicorona]|uniref:Uncharacterized protein n=1 Tax=Jimgerdemannia flammicorona TaxID=994334 RepID=A0A433Q5J3_9FUNG|nr:hypothetical protein BC938DRAFT_472705 [Jimgerdemannia flammicorona]